MPIGTIRNGSIAAMIQSGSKWWRSKELDVNSQLCAFTIFKDKYIDEVRVHHAHVRHAFLSRSTCRFILERRRARMVVFPTSTSPASAVYLVLERYPLSSRTSTSNSRPIPPCLLPRPLMPLPCSSSRCTTPHRQRRSSSLRRRSATQPTVTRRV